MLCLIYFQKTVNKCFNYFLLVKVDIQTDISQIGVISYSYSSSLLITLIKAFNFIV